VGDDGGVVRGERDAALVEMLWSGISSVLEALVSWRAAWAGVQSTMNWIGEWGV
jgi:hypothetical protein